MIMRWQNMTEQPFMNIQTWQLAATNGGSCNFMHSRGEVCSFLQSSAYYWMNEFHFDGLRMDAVGNLIYWQGGRKPWRKPGSSEIYPYHESGLKGKNP